MPAQHNHLVAACLEAARQHDADLACTTCNDNFHS